MISTLCLTVIIYKWKLTYILEMKYYLVVVAIVIAIFFPVLFWFFPSENIHFEVLARIKWTRKKFFVQFMMMVKLVTFYLWLF